MEMSSSAMAMESPSPTMKRRGSWSRLAADMAADTVNNLELGDDNHFNDGTSFHPPAKTHQGPSLPAIYSRSSYLTVPTKGGGNQSSGTIMSLFAAKDCYDPSSSMDSKTQAKQPIRSVFSSLALPTQKKQPRKDPLVEFHEERSKAEREYKKQQEAVKRRQQLRDHDEDKSLSSLNSLFDYLTKSGSADELLEIGTLDWGGGAGSDTMKRSGSMPALASFFHLFGDDKDEIAKLSSSKPVSNAETTEQSCLHAAVKQSKSVKGNRVYIRGKKAAEEGDWRKAVAYYHIALVKQRQYYGEDHIVTSNTLNALGLALVHMGEHFGGLTALEEALQIRQDQLGAGAKEVAETTNNIWMLLKASQEDHH